MELREGNNKSEAQQVLNENCNQNNWEKKFLIEFSFQREQVSKYWNILALDGSNWQKIDLFYFQLDIEVRCTQPPRRTINNPSVYLV
jgi:hypothetical protein